MGIRGDWAVLPCTLGATPCPCQELHMARAPAHQWQWLCVWAPVVTLLCR